MEDSVLGKLIEIEKEVQKKYESEEKKSEEWLEKIKSEAEKHLTETEKSLKISFTNTVQADEREIKNKIVMKMKEADESARKIEAVDDRKLKQIMFKHISRIIPGGEHDSQDVKN